MRKTKILAKAKIGEIEDGLKSAAVAVGSALGSLAQKVGLGKPAAVAAPKAKKKAAKKTVVNKAPAKKKAAPKKTAVAKKAITKKVAAKGTSPKKKSPAKKK